MPRKRDWCEECKDDPAGQRWLCRNIANHPDEPSPRERQVADYLAGEAAIERQAQARQECEESGHLHVDQDDRCVRCGHIDPFDFDDIPF
jgi:hypothetical protein